MTGNINFNMIADALALIDILSKNKDKFMIRSALFDARGHRISGSKAVEAQVITASNNPNVWFYRVKPLDGYVFMIMLVVSCSIDYGTPTDLQYPSSEYFRFVSHPLSTFQSGGAPNILVNFAAIGYKPKQLLSKLSQ